jgi:hypothetical protein
LVRPAGTRSALRVASDDQKRGVLGREQINELNEAIAEYIQLVKESLEYELEQRSETVAAEPEAVRRSATALVLAGRGGFDLAASQLIADAIRLELGIVVRCPSLGGLTGSASPRRLSPMNRRTSWPSSRWALSRRRSWTFCRVASG